MNIYFIVILAAMLGGYLIDLISTALNLGTLRDALPEEFAGVYDAEAYRKSQEYTRVRSTFGIVSETVNLTAGLAFWFAGGFAWADGVARGSGYGEIVTGLIFIGLLLVLRSILSLPFSVYSTFVIEERFGFNKTTAKTFILDIIKGTLLGVALGGPLLAGVIAFFQFAGPGAWFYCWIAITLFSLAVQYVAPTWIMPIFNKFAPLEEGALRKAIFDYAASVSFPLRDISVMDGSKRSGKSNAFFTGFGKNKRIALFDTLVEKHTVQELVAVLAHEIGHYKKRHIVHSLIIGTIQTGVTLYLLSIFLGHEGLFHAFMVSKPSVYAGLVFFGMLYSPIEVVLGMGMQALSRRNEFEADRYAVDTLPGDTSMITALKKLSVDNLSHLTPHPMTVFLSYSHPPVLQRIAAIRTAIAARAN